MFMASCGLSSGEVPGLQSVAMAIGTPASRSSWTGGFLVLLERVKGAGKQHRDRPGRGHRLGAGGVEMLEMVGRQRLVAARRARRRSGC